MRTRSPLLGALALILATLTLATRAENLGAIGPVYPIAEPHLLEFITSRLRERERSGDLARMEQEARQRATTTATSPRPVPGLRAADAPRTYFFDPTFTLDHNVVDAKGHVLFAAGARKNPLDVVSMSGHLLFFDARDPRQVTHAKALIDRYRGHVKPVLVGGSYLNLMKAWRTRVYFDQDGTLVRRLGIAAVPAIVSQDGSRLRIDEVPAR